MKIIFTHGYFLAEDPKEQEIMRPYVPLGILYLSAYLEKNGYENEVFDSTFSSFEELKKRLLKEKPDLVAMYTNLMTKLNVLKIIRMIREQPELNKTKIILGGPEVRNHAPNFLHYGADIIVVGEGEETMLELTRYFDNQEIFLKDIKGIIYQNDLKETISNPEREKIRDLNQLTFPNRKKVNLQLYFDAWKNRHGESAISVSTMRGCPYSCNWCSRAVYGQSYRRRSPVLVADELEWIEKNYQVDTAWFVDDVFTISHKWLGEFAEEMSRRKIKLRYECITRADRMNLEVIQLLKKSGCFRVWIGAESGSQKIIDAMDRRVKVEQVREMIQETRKAGLQAGTFIMVGYPGETEDDLKETVHHLKVADPDLYTITIAYPIKGTPLYAEVEDRFIEKLPWETSTDRMIDFKRSFSRKYYDYAIRWIYNEMAIHKAGKINGRSIRKITTHKIKSLASRGLMAWEKATG